MLKGRLYTLEVKLSTRNSSIPCAFVCVHSLQAFKKLSVKKGKEAYFISLLAILHTIELFLVLLYYIIIHAIDEFVYY